MNMADAFDINEEYEKVFGKETRENIFGPDDEDYKSLRQLIIDSRRVFNFSKSLPFEGVTLLSNEEIERAKIVDEAQSKGYRIFYIRRYVKHELATYAAGYFNPNDSRFIVLKGTFFSYSDYLASLVRLFPPHTRMRFSTDYQHSNGVLTQKNDWFFSSASLAASCVLGSKCTFREWTDDSGKTLDAYYAKYKSADIDNMEERSFPDYIKPSSPLADIIAAVLRHAETFEYY